MSRMLRSAPSEVSKMSEWFDDRTTRWPLGIRSHPLYEKAFSEDM